MSALTLRNDLPGITGAMVDHPETAGALSALADSLLNTSRGGMSRFERELIATYVSRLNGCEFCTESHLHFAAEVFVQSEEVTLTLDDAVAMVRRMIDNPDMHVAIDRRWMLLVIAEYVQENRPIPQDLLIDARRAGATEVAIHDTILIASAFCMFNRYVEGAGNPPPDDDVYYRDAAKVIVKRGYGRK